jgi:hydrogenase expression/formation protein HypC
VPGRIVEAAENAQGMLMGRVDFGGVGKEVCLAYVPEAKVGDYVIVHVGFAISVVSEAEAAETFELLRQMGELEEAAEPEAGAGPSGADAPGGAGDVPGGSR